MGQNALLDLLLPAQVTLTGATELPYLYTECDLHGLWNAFPGNYAFLNVHNQPIYFGETENFVTRPLGPSHEYWPLAVLLGATKIVAHVNHNGQAVRRAEEADLIAAYNPPLNVQHQPKPAAAQARRNALIDLLRRAPR